MAVDLTSHRYTFWRLADKMVRRARLLAGRPDNSPWIMEARRSARTAQVDFVFALNYLSPRSRFVRIFHEAMSAYGLSMLLVNCHNVHKLTRQIEEGWLRPHVLLDLCSWPGDAFEQLLQTAGRCGVYTIRNWQHTPWVYKSHTHSVLEQAGLPVPPTVILRAGDSDRELTEEERQWLGPRCAIKPSVGGASRGVVVNVNPTLEAIARARAYDRKDDWLIQKMIDWTHFGHRPAYLRGYNICGHRTLLWWCKDNGRDSYDLLDWDELDRYGLMPAVRLVDRLAEITGMDFFSTEIALSAQEGEGRYCLIDYVNDQCDLDPDAHPEFSPPEPFARWACHCIAEFVWRRKHALPAPAHRGLFLCSG